MVQVYDVECNTRYQTLEVKEWKISDEKWHFTFRVFEDPFLTPSFSLFILCFPQAPRWTMLRRV